MFARGDCQSKDRCGPAGRDRPKGLRGATGSLTTPHSGRWRPSCRPRDRWLAQCQRCDFEFRSIRMIGPNGVRTWLQHFIDRRAAMSEGDEDDNRPPYTLWTCRLRTGSRCKSLSINTLSEDDKGYFRGCRLRGILSPSKNLRRRQILHVLSSSDGALRGNELRRHCARRRQDSK